METLFELYDQACFILDERRLRMHAGTRRRH